MTELSTLIRRRRLALRLTQRDAAKRARVSLATWQNLERPTSDPRRFQDLTLARAAHGLRLEPGWLFAAVGRPIPPSDLPTGLAGGTADDTDVSRLIEHLGVLLRELSERSTDSLLLVYGQAAETATHLLEVHEAN